MIHSQKWQHNVVVGKNIAVWPKLQCTWNCEGIWQIELRNSVWQSFLDYNNEVSYDVTRRKHDWLSSWILGFYWLKIRRCSIFLDIIAAEYSGFNTILTKVLFQLILKVMQCFTFDCLLRGYHVYKNIWTPNLSDNLQVRLCQNVISYLLDIQFLPQADLSTTSTWSWLFIILLCTIIAIIISQVS